jgi:ankyrin repeat protein
VCPATDGFRTFLHVAARHGNLAAATVLLGRGCPVNDKDCRAGTSLHAVLDAEPEVCAGPIRCYGACGLVESKSER